LAGICPTSEIKEALAQYKKEYVDRNDQTEAKKCWIYEQVLKIQELFEQAFSELQRTEYYPAWCTLEKCEIAIHFLLPHIDAIGGDNHKINFIETHIRRFQSIYPYAVFFSPEILELEKKCNICEQVISLRSPCGHRVGEVYNGELCYRIVTKFEFIGSAIVDTPLQKYSVLFLADEQTGQQKDHYNYAPVEYVTNALASPYIAWDVLLTTRKHSITKFQNVDGTQKCPCGSKLTFEQCCSNKNEIEMKHYQFSLSEHPPGKAPAEVLFVNKSCID
jgi:hypothetical protein